MDAQVRRGSVPVPTLALYVWVSYPGYIISLSPHVFTIKWKRGAFLILVGKIERGIMKEKVRRRQ